MALVELSSYDVFKLQVDHERLLVIVMLYGRLKAPTMMNRKQAAIIGS